MTLATENIDTKETNESDEYTQHVQIRGLGSRKIQRLQNRVAKNGHYWGINHQYARFPKITGMPYMDFERIRMFKYKTMMGDVKTGAKVAPRSANLRKIINFPYVRWGAPQVAIVGKLGCGKSNLLNLIMAMQLARGLHVITFNDRRFEARSLAAHGWFDKNKVFHPFEIDVWIPEGYEFRKSNPIWNYYPNVQLCEYNNVDDIFESMAPHRLTVVYEEAFDEKNRLLLWLDLMDRLTEGIDVKKIYSFTHHEFSRLVPEVPSKGIATLAHKAANIVSNARKDRLGILTTFHMTSEVFYRISQKFTHILHKKPVNKRYLQKVEKDAKSLPINGVNITDSGYWMQHKVNYFPELPDMFRLVPQREKLEYPSLKVAEDKEKNGFKKEEMIYEMYLDGVPQTKIAQYFKVTPPRINHIIKAMKN